MPNTEAPRTSSATAAAPKGGRANSRGSTSGVRRVRSPCTVNPASIARPADTPTVAGRVRPWATSVNPNTSTARPGESSRAPRRSKAVRRVEGGTSGTWRGASRMAIAPIGRLTRNSHGQGATARMEPPASGPSTGDSSGTTATTLITRPVRPGPATRASSACPVAGSSPPPRPWTTRNTIRLVTDQADAHSTEPSRNTPTATSHVRRPPNRSASQPDAGTAATTASR